MSLLDDAASVKGEHLPFVNIEKKEDNVNHPKHYTNHPSGIECIQITEHMGFCVGNVIKYCWRSDNKNGLEDLKKAQWYLNREIVRREKEQDNG